MCQYNIQTLIVLFPHTKNFILNLFLWQQLLWFVHFQFRHTRKTQFSMNTHWLYFWVTCPAREVLSQTNTEGLCFLNKSGPCRNRSGAVLDSKIRPELFLAQMSFSVNRAYLWSPPSGKRNLIWNMIKMWVQKRRESSWQIYFSQKHFEGINLRVCTGPVRKFKIGHLNAD